MIWLCIVMVLAIVIMVMYYMKSVEPMGQALMCTCLSTGQHCEEANKFSDEFWHRYWKIETPQIFKDVDVLKKAWKEEKESLVQVTSLAAQAARHAGTAAVAAVASEVTAARKEARRAGRAASR